MRSTETSRVMRRVAASAVMGPVVIAGVGGGVALSAVVATAQSSVAAADTFKGTKISLDGGREVNYGGLGWTDSDGQFKFCLDAGKEAPDALPTDPAKISEYDNPVVGYITAKFSDPEQDATTLAAASVVIRDVLDKSPEHAEARKVLEADHPDVIKRAAELKAEAAKYAGAYKVAPALAPEQAKAPAELDLTGVGVRSAKGEWLAGYKVTVTVTGGTINGKAAWAGTTTGKAQTLKVVAAKPGEVKVRVQVAGLPSTSSVIYAPSKPGDQRVLGEAKPVTASGSTQARVVTPPPPPAPPVTFKTQVTKQALVPGQSVADVVTSTGTTQTPVEARWSLYTTAKKLTPEQCLALGQDGWADLIKAGEAKKVAGGSVKIDRDGDTTLGETTVPADADWTCGTYGEDGYSLKTKKKVVEHAPGATEQAFVVEHPPAPPIVNTGTPAAQAMPAQVDGVADSGTSAAGLGGLAAAGFGLVLGGATVRRKKSSNT